MVPPRPRDPRRTRTKCIRLDPGERSWRWTRIWERTTRPGADPAGCDNSGGFGGAYCYALYHDHDDTDRENSRFGVILWDENSFSFFFSFSLSCFLSLSIASGFLNQTQASFNHLSYLQLLPQVTQCRSLQHRDSVDVLFKKRRQKICSSYPLSSLPVSFWTTVNTGWAVGCFYTQDISLIFVATCLYNHPPL